MLSSVLNIFLNKSSGKNWQKLPEEQHCPALWSRWHCRWDSSGVSSMKKSFRNQPRTRSRVEGGKCCCKGRAKGEGQAKGCNCWVLSACARQQPLIGSCKSLEPLDHGFAQRSMPSFDINEEYRICPTISNVDLLHKYHIRIVLPWLHVFPPFRMDTNQLPSRQFHYQMILVENRNLSEATKVAGEELILKVGKFFR